MLRLPPSRKELKNLEAGDEIALSGKALTMRDAALERLEALEKEGLDPPFDIEGQLVFHAGPTPPAAGRPCGSIGPTTSARMDRFVPMLGRMGAAAVLGKGPRGEEGVESHSSTGILYLVTVGGLGALLGGRVESMEPVEWEELGPEAVFEVVLRDFPAVVALDAGGRDLFAERQAVYRRDKPLNVD